MQEGIAQDTINHRALVTRVCSCGMVRQLPLYRQSKELSNLSLRKMTNRLVCLSQCHRPSPRVPAAPLPPFRKYHVLPASALAQIGEKYAGIACLSRNYGMEFAGIVTHEKVSPGGGEAESAARRIFGLNEAVGESRRIVVEAAT